MLFTASFVYEAWGWTVGPRHLSPLAAFLVLARGGGDGDGANLAVLEWRGDVASACSHAVYRIGHRDLPALSRTASSPTASSS